MLSAAQGWTLAPVQQQPAVEAQPVAPAEVEPTVTAQPAAAAQPAAQVQPTAAAQAAAAAMRANVDAALGPYNIVPRYDHDDPTYLGSWYVVTRGRTVGVFRHQ